MVDTWDITPTWEWGIVYKPQVSSGWEFFRNLHLTLLRHRASDSCWKSIYSPLMVRLSLPWRWYVSYCLSNCQIKLVCSKQIKDFWVMELFHYASNRIYQHQLEKIVTTKQHKVMIFNRKVNRKLGSLSCCLTWTDLFSSVFLSSYIASIPLLSMAVTAENFGENLS